MRSPVDGAPLTGGLGKLTDGVIATQVWNTVSNAAGTGQYVGWLKSVSPNPTILFTFAATAVIDEIDIWLDNSGVGSVIAPSAILIDGVSRAFTAPAAGTVGEVSFTGLDLHGATHTVEFFQAGGNSWTFVSEIAFAGTAVPEPDAASLLGIGLIGTLLLRRRAPRSVEKRRREPAPRSLGNTAPLDPPSSRRRPGPNRQARRTGLTWAPTCAGVTFLPVHAATRTPTVRFRLGKIERPC